MKKYLDAMFYGDTKTKVYLWVMFFLTTVALGLLIAGLALLSGGYIGGAIALGLFVLLLSQSVTLSDTGYNPDETKEERDERRQKIKEKKIEEKEEKRQQKENNKNNMKEETSEEEEKEALENDKKEPESFDNYDEKKLKQYFHKYKVKKDHRSVVIDSSGKYKIRQCPGYIWTFRGVVHLLLIEENPRKIQFPEAEARRITFEKNVLALPKKDYQEFYKPSVISNVFAKYLPSYREVNYQGKRSFRKNLYALENGIRFTNTSAKEVFDILNPEFCVEDEVTKSVKFTDEFKELYKNRILLNDHIIDIKEYQSRMKKVLEEFAKKANSKSAFSEGLAQMVKYQLITEEYRIFYLEHRDDFVR